MNAQPSSCDALHEPISLLAAGCLPPEEQAAVRGHLDGCQACAARFAELTAMCGSLARSRPATAPAEVILRRWDALAADGLPRPPARSTRSLAPALAAAIAASLLLAAWWMADHRATPPLAKSPSRIHLAIHELAHADTDAEFDEALRRHYGSATFGATGSTSRPRDLMKEFLQ
jgi:anti-sigma factor RsiW